MDYALITGASSGMGLEFARQLAQKGYGIIIVSNQEVANLQVQDRLKTEYGVDVRCIHLDLTQQDAAEIIYHQVEQWQLEVDVLVSNAGMLLFSSLTRTPIQKLEQIMALHCVTPMKLIRLFGESMQQRQGGHIVITSSATAWMPFPTISHYGATKAFLKNFAKSIYYEFKRYGVSVTTLFPGAVDTPFYTLSNDKRHLFRRLGLMQTPQYVVRRALLKMEKGKFSCVPGCYTRFICTICANLPLFMVRLLLRIPPVKHLFETL